MENTRRDLLLMGGGAAVGVWFTPVPWKLLDDVSIWTQNWSWLPTPVRGEVTSRHSACTLCPAGCAVKARCVAGHPFSLAAVADDPVSRGALCALGLGAHQLPFAENRLRSALRRGREVPMEEAVAGVAAAVAAAHRDGKTVAILDQRPGRSISLLYQRLLASFSKGLYVVPPLPERGTPDWVARAAGGAVGRFAYDFEHAKTILSISTPVLDGWGAPGRMTRLWSQRAGSGLRFLHAEPRLSRTAALADRWLAIRPGSETAFVLGVLAVLFEEQRVHAARPQWLAALSLEEAARATGVEAKDLAQTARDLAEGGPSVIVGGGDPVAGPLATETERAIAALNLVLGSVGTKGGIVERIATPGPAEGRVVPETALFEVEPGTIDVLLVDSATSGCAIAPPVLRRRLAPRATVICLAAYRTPAALAAEFTLPAPAPFESAEDVPSPPDAVSASWAFAAPLYPQPAGVLAPEAVVARLAAAAGLAAPGTVDDLFRQKATAIAEARRGRVFVFDKGEWEPTAGPDDLWKKFQAGAVWVDDAAAPSRAVHPEIAALTLSEAPGDRAWPLQATPTGWRGSAAGVPLPPLATKLTRESHLRPPGGEAMLHPVTAREAGVEGGGNAVVETPSGSAAVTVHVDPGVPPGLVEVAAEGPGADATLALFGGAGEDCWRLSQARIRRS